MTYALAMAALEVALAPVLAAESSAERISDGDALPDVKVNKRMTKGERRRDKRRRREQRQREVRS